MLLKRKRINVSVDPDKYLPLPLFLCVFFFFPSPPPSASLAACPPPQVSPDDAEQKAVHLLACSSDTLPAPLPPISMFDLLEALKVRRSAKMSF